MRTLKHRLGQFLFVIGLILFIIFFAQGQNPWPIFFFTGLAGMILGFLMMRGTRVPSESSERFRTVRKYMQKPKKR